ncbi:MAG: hypothetical protein ACYTEL_14265 [Planctomycetota bacterium]
MHRDGPEILIPAPSDWVDYGPVLEAGAEGSWDWYWAGATPSSHEKRTWFMYYNDFDRFWDLKLAPAGDTDTTPPTTPKNISAAYEDGKIKLSWEAASDPDTGIVIYVIYRNGRKLGSTKALTFLDAKLQGANSCTYGLSAVNLHGTEGPIEQITIRKWNS